MYISLWILVPIAIVFGSVVYWWMDASKLHSYWYNRYLQNHKMMLDRQERYLTVLKRELANEFLSPQMVIKVEREIDEFIRRIEGDSVDPPMSDHEIGVEWEALVQQYPEIYNFDIVSLRHYVPYEAAKESHYEVDFYNAYLDMSKFMILSERKEGGYTSPLLYMVDMEHVYEVVK